MFLIIVVFISVAYGSYLYFKNVHSFNKKLAVFPSPPGSPILGNALDFLSNKSRLDVFENYRKKCGDVVFLKVGFDRLLLVSNYELMQFILSQKNASQKSKNYKVFRKWLGNGLITAEGDQWKKLHRLIAPAFSYNFLHVFESNSDILIKKLTEQVGKSTNLWDYIHRCTLDVILEAAMNSSINAQENIGSQYANSLKEMLRIVTERNLKIHKLIDFLYFFTDDYTKEKEALKILHSFSWKLINDRSTASRKTDEKKSFIDLLLETESLTLEEIRAEVDTFTFAGHETVASSICFILYNLAEHLDIQRKVYLEQIDIFGDDINRSTTASDLSKMKYLNCVIKESLRLFPPGALFARRLLKDLQFKDFMLPQGATVVLFSYGMHRDSKYFVEPDKFIPERFANNDQQTVFGFLPFGVGPRRCIGEKFAMTEMKSIVAKLVRNFRFLPTAPRHVLQLDIQTVLTSSNGVFVRIENRNQQKTH